MNSFVFVCELLVKEERWSKDNC